jgi:hypothetical protein
MSLPDKPAAAQPWLKNPEWAAREIRCGPGIRGVFVVLTYLIFGLASLTVVATASRSTGHGIFFAAFVVLLFLILPGYLTFIWLRHIKYGDSICRLITLPGIIGGWFKADVECNLPLDPSEPVQIQLINNITNPGARGSSEAWRMEQTHASTPISVGSMKRSIVRVRLKIPRVAGQEPIPLKAGFLERQVAWYLVIKKKTAGINFLAQFSVPIYAVSDAPQSEQLPE